MFKEVFDILLVENQSAENSIKAAQLAHSLLKRGDGLIDFRSNNCYQFTSNYEQFIEKVSKNFFHDEIYSHITVFNDHLHKNTAGRFDLDEILIHKLNDKFLLNFFKLKLSSKRKASILNQLLNYDKINVFKDIVKQRSISYNYLLRTINPFFYGRLYSIVDIESKQEIHATILNHHDALNIIIDIIDNLKNESELIFSKFIRDNKEMIGRIICNNMIITNSITNVIDFYLINCEQDYICKLMSEKIVSESFRTSEMSKLLSKTLINNKLILANLCESDYNKNIISEFCKHNPSLKNFALMI